MEAVKRPPVGLIPHDVWFSGVVKERCEAIVTAMWRYTNDLMPVPAEWILEFRGHWDSLKQCLFRDTQSSTGQTQINFERLLAQMDNYSNQKQSFPLQWMTNFDIDWSQLRDAS
jgi:hypothetical protein